jgi:hypothetical protein
MLPLREALAAKLTDKNKIPTTPDQVIATVGGSQALVRRRFKRARSRRRCAGLLALLDADCRSDPRRTGSSAAGAYQHRAPQRHRSTLSSSPRRTRAASTTTRRRTPAAWSSPAEAEEVAAFAIERDLIVVADEAYEDLVYDGSHFSIASLPGMAERTITCYTFSKTYAMTGWRGGYAVAPEPFMTALRKIVLYSTNGVTTFVQQRHASGAQDARAEIAWRREEYRKRRDLLVAGLNEVGLECAPPAGAFYAFPNAEKIHKNSRTAAEILLEKAHIATIPGSVFGAQGEGHLRFGYAISIPEIEACVESFHSLARFSARFCRESPHHRLKERPHQQILLRQPIAQPQLRPARQHQRGNRQRHHNPQQHFEHAMQRQCPVRSRSMYQHQDGHRHPASRELFLSPSRLHVTIAVITASR